MLALFRDPIETGVFIALAAYGLILAWSLLARLKWLPGVILRPVRRLLDRLGRLPVLGRAVTATRRHPMTLGLFAAILTGILVPSLVISLYALVGALTFMALMYVGIRYGGFGEEDSECVSQESLTYGDAMDPLSYDEEWMRARGKLPRPGGGAFY